MSGLDCKHPEDDESIPWRLVSKQAIKKETACQAVIITITINITKDNKKHKKKKDIHTDRYQCNSVDV